MQNSANWTEPPAGERIEVSWIDTVTHPGWQTDATKLAGAPNRTIGYFINMDDEYVRVSHTFCDMDGQLSDITVIPTNVVADIVVLTLK